MIPIDRSLYPWVVQNPYPNLLKTHTLARGMGFWWVGYG